jgi:hypothetical protein
MHGPRTFNAPTVPFILDTDRSQNMPTYASATVMYKAFALNIDGAFWMVDSSMLQSQAEADALALQSCEASANGQPCTLYAEGNQVVFNVSSLVMNQTPTVSYTQTVLDISKIPFVMNVAKQSMLNLYASHKVSATQHNSIAISWDGANEIAYGWSTSSAANTAAVNGCNQVAQYSSCFLYAVDNTVVMTMSDIVH